MINTDEDLFICDMAETYGIFEYRRLPLSLAATLAFGLRENSRIHMRLNNMKVDVETLMRASMVDHLAIMTWMKTKDAEYGNNRPDSLVEKLLGTEKESEYEVFDTEEEFDAEWDRLCKEKA